MADPAPGRRRRRADADDERRPRAAGGRVYRLVAADTIEEKVLALQERKRDLSSRVVDDDGALTGPLTVDDVRGLFG